LLEERAWVGDSDVYVVMTQFQLMMWSGDF
jgi:hypothetical protein